MQMSPLATSVRLNNSVASHRGVRVCVRGRTVEDGSALVDEDDVLNEE